MVTMPVSSRGYVYRLKFLPLPFDPKRYGPPNPNRYLLTIFIARCCRISHERSNEVLEAHSPADLPEHLLIILLTFPTHISKTAGMGLVIDLHQLPHADVGISLGC